MKITAILLICLMVQNSQALRCLTGPKQGAKPMDCAQLSPAIKFKQCFTLKGTPLNMTPVYPVTSVNIFFQSEILMK